jgi:hypothetical protein
MGARAPVHGQAINPAVYHGMDAHGLMPAQPAAVVVAQGVESRMQAGVDGPVLYLGLEPLPRDSAAFGRLVMRMTVSGCLPSRCRWTRAAWATSGKPSTVEPRTRRQGDCTTPRDGRCRFSSVS